MAKAVLTDNSDWIKLSRKIIESQVFCNPITLKIWIWMLVKAKHKDSFISLKVGKGSIEVKLKRGQLIFGRNAAHEVLDIPASTIYRHMEKLQEMGNILIAPDNQYSVITICNYNTYQSINPESGQPTDSQRTTNGQLTDSQRTQYKNVNNEEESKEEKEIRLLPPKLDLKFYTVTFKDAWIDWLDYKATQHKFTYKTISSHQKGLNTLWKQSQKNEDEAIDMLETATAKGWMGWVAKAPTQSFNSNGFHKPPPAPPPSVKTAGELLALRNAQ